MANTYLKRTLSSSGNRKTWTFSAWIKRGNISGKNMDLFGTEYSGLKKGGLYIDTSERLYYAQYEAGGGSNSYALRTTRLLRDPNSWYHIVCTWATTNSTSNDSEITALSLGASNSGATIYTNSGTTYSITDSNGDVLIASTVFKWNGAAWVKEI